MRIFHSLDNLPEFQKTVFTQGTFDGLHIGHQKILETVRNKAKAIAVESVLLTFWPHPRLLLFPEDTDLKLLQTLEEKLEIIEKCGIDNVIVLPFTKNFRNILPEDYIHNFLVNELNVHTIIVGYDHRFGRNREGDITVLKQFSKQYNYEVCEIAAEDIDHIAISSTKIRNSLLNGDVDTANSYLGRYYSFKGHVIYGKQLGRTLGFPTANLKILDNHKLIPAIGVYAVRCKIGEELYDGMMNIGNNPTVEGKAFFIEVNIFNFLLNIYDEVIEVFLIKWLRDEKKFPDLDTLVLSLQQDRVNATKLLQNI